MQQVVFLDLRLDGSATLFWPQEIFILPRGRRRKVKAPPTPDLLPELPPMLAQGKSQVSCTQSTSASPPQGSPTSCLTHPGSQWQLSRWGRAGWPLKPELRPRDSRKKSPRIRGKTQGSLRNPGPPMIRRGRFDPHEVYVAMGGGGFLLPPGSGKGFFQDGHAEAARQHCATHGWQTTGLPPVLGKTQQSRHMRKNTVVLMHPPMRPFAGPVCFQGRGPFRLDHEIRFCWPVWGATGGTSGVGRGFCTGGSTYLIVGGAHLPQQLRPWGSGATGGVGGITASAGPPFQGGIQSLF